MIHELLDEFVVVSDEALLAATRVLIEKTRTLVEPAGAAPLAAALAPTLQPRLAGRRIALICTGSNVSPMQLRALMGREILT